MKTQGCSCEGASYGLPLGAPFREPLESPTVLGPSQRESLRTILFSPVERADRPICRNLSGEPLQSKDGETDVKPLLMATMAGPSPLRPGGPGFFKAGLAFQRTEISSDSDRLIPFRNLVLAAGSYASLRFCSSRALCPLHSSASHEPVQAMECYRSVGTAPTPIERRKTFSYPHRRSRYRVVGYAP
jgi:hypothetical protein